MPGLFGILNMGSRSLQTQQQGVAVAGQNLANVNNPAYARQRVSIQTSPAVNGPLGPQGTGADAVAIVQIRSGILDQQIQSEASVRGSLEAQQLALQYAQANLGTQIDSVAPGNSTTGVEGSHSLADGLSDLFNSFQSVSASPTSMGERQTLLMNAVSLTTQFNRFDQRLGELKLSLNQSVQDDVASANQLLSDIAKLNNKISTTEASANGTANDLRDLRQQKVEDLAKFVKIDVSTGDHGSMDISIAGTTMVAGNQVTESLQTYDAGGGQILVRGATTAMPLTLTGGSIQGTIDARDGALTDLRTNVNALAAQLISEVNTAHAAGFSLTGSTGGDFFTGTNASDIHVNDALLDDPSLVQAAGVSGATGDNKVALALAQIANKKLPALNGQTLSEGYSQTVAELGQSLASVNTQLSDQEVVENMLMQQRSSISGVSLDEEMTDLTRFQKAYVASARLITTVDEMLDTVMNMKR